MSANKDTYNIPYFPREVKNFSCKFYELFVNIKQKEMPSANDLAILTRKELFYKYSLV